MGLTAGQVQHSTFAPYLLSCPLTLWLPQIQESCPQGKAKMYFRERICIQNSYVLASGASESPDQSSKHLLQKQSFCQNINNQSEASVKSEVRCGGTGMSSQNTEFETSLVYTVTKELQGHGIQVLLMLPSSSSESRIHGDFQPVQVLGLIHSQRL